MVIAVAGCVAQAEGAEITRAPPGWTSSGPAELPPPAGAGGARGARRRRVIDTEFPTEDKFDHLPEAAAPQGVSAFLTIQEGCDKFCAFCVVPYTRGAESPAPPPPSSPRRGAWRPGVREITLLGQNVNAWHGEGRTGWRSGAAAGARGDPRRRAAALHHLPPARHGRRADRRPPRHPAVMPFLHLPVQSGSDRVLQAMNRGHAAADYLRLVEKLRAARPTSRSPPTSSSATPARRDADHQATLALIREVGFAQSFSFKYSPRPGTPAAGMAGQVRGGGEGRAAGRGAGPARFAAGGFQCGRDGHIVDVLFTHPGRRPGQLGGRSPWLQPVHVLAPSHLVGRVAPVRIVAGNPFSLQGELVHQEMNAA
jgi:tRNA-2-methylthio-N6-dimethylallyladenosine synthase